MPTEIQTAQDIWPQLASIVFVPRTESDYHRLSALTDDLGTLVDKCENHPYYNSGNFPTISTVRRLT